MKQASPPGDLERARAIATWRNSGLPHGKGYRPPVESTLHRGGSGWNETVTTTVGFPNAKFADVRPPLDADRFENDRAA